MCKHRALVLEALEGRRALDAGGSTVILPLGSESQQGEYRIIETANPFVLTVEFKDKNGNTQIFQIPLSEEGGLVAEGEAPADPISSQPDAEGSGQTQPQIAASMAAPMPMNVDFKGISAPAFDSAIQSTVNNFVPPTITPSASTLPHQWSPAPTNDWRPMLRERIPTVNRLRIRGENFEIRVEGFSPSHTHIEIVSPRGIIKVANPTKDGGQNFSVPLEKLKLEKGDEFEIIIQDDRFIDQPEPVKGSFDELNEEKEAIESKAIILEQNPITTAAIALVAISQRHARNRLENLRRNYTRGYQRLRELCS